MKTPGLFWKAAAVALLLVMQLFFGQLYQHSFGTNTINTHPYQVAPDILAAHLSNSKWTNSKGSWTSYAGSSGQALSLADSSGNPVITLEFKVEAGYKLSLTSLQFWNRRSASGATNFSLTINGTTAGSGTISETGANSGTIATSGITDLTGTVQIQLQLSGASGTGTFRLDDFTINGTVSPIAIKPEPTDFPTAFTAGTATSNSIPLTWTDAAGTVPPDGYLIRWSAISFADITPPTDGTFLPNSGTAQNIPQGIQNYTVSGLMPATNYYFKIWPYTNSGGDVNYKVGAEPQVTESTFCGDMENFENIPTNNSGSYQPRTWAGKGGQWNASHARTDQTLTNKAICTDAVSTVTSPTLSGGIGILSFKYVRGFTNSGTRTLEVYINGSKIGTSIVVNPNGDTVQDYAATVNITGNVVIELRTSGAQIIIDDLSWTCYTGATIPDINIKGKGISIPSGTTATSTADGTDFGSMISGASASQNFTLENTGAGTLTLNTPAVAFADGSQGFSVSAQPATNPMTGFSAQNFSLSFSNTVPGTYTDTVIIPSNDPDENPYTFAVTATVLQPVIMLNQAAQNLSLAGFQYYEAEGPSTLQNFRVDGTNLAGDITVTASSNWEISSNATYDGSNEPPYSTVNFPKSGGNAVTNKTIHIRLKAGLPAGNYSGTITLTSPQAQTRTVTVSGSVLPARVNMVVKGGIQTIADGSTTVSSLNRTQFATLNLGESQSKTYTITNTGGAPLILNNFALTGTDAVNFSFVETPPPGTVILQGQSRDFTVKFAPTTVGQKNAVVNIDNNDPLKNPYDFAIRGKANFCGATGEYVLAQQGFETVPEFTDLPYIISGDPTMYGSATGFSSGKSGSGDKPSDNNLYSETARGYRIQGGTVANSVLTPLSFEFGPVNTANYTDLNLSFRVAGFSLGGNSNGMDDLDANGLPTTDDSAKIDFILVEISPDNGNTWYKQAKVVSDSLDVAWSFSSTAAMTGMRAYAANNSLIYFKSKNNQRYNKVVIEDLPAVSALKIRISAQDNAENESWILDDVRITSSGIVPKVWDGSSWSPSPPVKSDKIIINGNYSTASAVGDLQACQCEVSTGATLTVAAGRGLIIGDQVINNGNMIVENDASFVQMHDLNTNSGSGTLTARRNAQLKRLDYNYWTSPVSGQNLKTFSPGTLNTRFYTYNEGNDLFDVIDPLTNNFGNTSSTVFESAAKGYAIRAYNTYPPASGTTPAPVQTFVGNFTGIPNNGPLTFPLAYHSGTGTYVGSGYNLVGNPYPSNLDFYQLADNNTAVIHKVAYFWTNINPTPAMMGQKYPEDAYNNYAILNGTGGLPATLGSNTSVTTAISTRILKVGQGFIVQAKQSGNLQYSNAVRTTNSTAVFFNRNNNSEMPPDRFWLQLKSPLGVITTTLIGYVPDATDGYEADYDSKLLAVGADAVYSILGESKLGIQGRALPFRSEDRVPLGTRHFSAGAYTFSLAAAEGIFEGDQKIFLKDNLTGAVHDLSAGAYTFTAEKGATDNRFEIHFESPPLLGTEGSGGGQVQVYRDGDHLILRSRKDHLSKVELWEMSGRLLHTEKVSGKTVQIGITHFPAGLYLLRSVCDGRTSVHKVRLD